MLSSASLLVERDGCVKVVRGSLAIAEYPGQIGLGLGAAVILVDSSFPVPIEGFRKILVYPPAHLVHRTYAEFAKGIILVGVFLDKTAKAFGLSTGIPSPPQ